MVMHCKNMLKNTRILYHDIKIRKFIVCINKSPLEYNVIAYFKSDLLWNKAIILVLIQYRHIISDCIYAPSYSNAHVFTL